MHQMFSLEQLLDRYIATDLNVHVSTVNIPLSIAAVCLIIHMYTYMVRIGASPSSYIGEFGTYKSIFLYKVSLVQKFCNTATYMY